MFQEVSAALKAAPPVAFDVVRQVRVYEPYLQYVEMRLSGAALQNPGLRSRRGFRRLVEGGRAARPGEDDVRPHRTWRQTVLEGSRGRAAGNPRHIYALPRKKLDRVVLKSKKPLLQERLASFKQKLEAHQVVVRAELQPKLDESRKQIVDYYLPRVVESPPDVVTPSCFQNQLAKRMPDGGGPRRKWTTCSQVQRIWSTRWAARGRLQGRDLRNIVESGFPRCGEGSVSEDQLGTCA